MPQQPERKRPSYEPNKEFIKSLRAQSGKSIADFAKECGCAESTLLNMLAGENIDGAILVRAAQKLKIPHWHDLLSEAERKRLGVGQPTPTAFSPPAGSPPSTASASLASLLPSSRFQLPAVLSDFTGRDEQIQKLTRHLRAGAGTTAWPSLRGMGGVGKTSLAIRIAHEVKDLFPDAQLFLELRGTSDGVKESGLTPAEAMSRVIRAFHPDMIQLPDDDNELAGIYRSVLTGKRVLIIFDNAGSEAQLRPLLTVSPPVAILITSRHAQALDGVQSVLVDGLPPDAAFSLLRRITGPRGSRHELSAIVELCDCLPLALRVAGDFLRLKEDWPVSSYIDALQRERLRWLKVGADPEKDVEAVLKLSSAQLVRDSVDRATRWHLLHILPGDFDLQAAAAAWNADENDLSVLNDLSDLASRSLLTFNSNTGRYHLHDLMRPIAQGLFG